MGCSHGESSVRAAEERDDGASPGTAVTIPTAHGKGLTTLNKAVRIREDAVMQGVTKRGWLSISAKQRKARTKPWARSSTGEQKELRKLKSSTNTDWSGINPDQLRVSDNHEDQVHGMYFSKHSPHLRGQKGDTVRATALTSSTAKPDRHRWAQRGTQGNSFQSLCSYKPVAPSLPAKHWHILQLLSSTQEHRNAVHAQRTGPASRARNARCEPLTAHAAGSVAGLRCASTSGAQTLPTPLHEVRSAFSGAAGPGVWSDGRDSWMFNILPTSKKEVFYFVGNW